MADDIWRKSRSETCLVRCWPISDSDQVSKSGPIFRLAKVPKSKTWWHNRSIDPSRILQTAEEKVNSKVSTSSVLNATNHPSSRIVRTYLNHCQSFKICVPFARGLFGISSLATNFISTSFFLVSPLAVRMREFRSLRPLWTFFCAISEPLKVVYAVALTYKYVTYFRRTSQAFLWTAVED